MATRDDLIALIQQLPEEKLRMVQTMLEHQLRPPQQTPEMQQMQARASAFRESTLQRFRETGKPGTIRTAGGSGFSGEHQGTPFGRKSFHYWDDKALVFQSLQSFDGQEVEFMEWLSFSTDRTALHVEFEISSGGHVVRHQDSFPIARKNESQSS